LVMMSSAHGVRNSVGTAVGIAGGDSANNSI